MIPSEVTKRKKLNKLCHIMKCNGKCLVSTNALFILIPGEAESGKGGTSTVASEPQKSVGHSKLDHLQYNTNAI